MIHPLCDGMSPPRGAGQRNLSLIIPAITFWLWLILGTGLVFAQEVKQPTPELRKISPNEAVELAIKNNLNLESARITGDTKKRKSDLAWNVFVPSVDIRGSLVRDNEAGSSGALTVKGMTSIATLPGGFEVYDRVIYGTVDLPQWHIAGSLSVSLNLNFAMFEEMRNLRVDYEGGLISYEKAKIQLERDVRQSYYQMLLLQENIALLRESYATSQRRVEMAEANYRSGLAPELTWLQARVAMENMKPTIDQAENGLKLAMANFAMNLGLSYDTQFELIPVSDAAVFIPLDVADLISKAASGKPEILELRQNILLLESGRKALFYRNYTPYMALTWNMAPAFIADPWKDDWFNGDNWNRSGSFTLSLGMRLDTLLPFTAGPQSIENLDDNIRTTRIGLAQMIRGTELEIYNTVLSLEKARITVEAQSLTADLAERTYRLTEEAYKAGLNELLEVQNAELELRRARIGVLEQNFTYLQGLIDLEYSIGVPFGTLSSLTENVK
jgi:outer membrane protein TolC